MSWLRPRATEATAQQIAATGAAGYGVATDDPDLAGLDGFRRAGGAFRREVPQRTRERATTMSVAGYRSNPMAKAIIDTYVSFAVGDSGVTATATHPEVAQVVDEFWRDPRVRFGSRQELMLRSHLLAGETVNELLVGATTGVVRRNPFDPARVTGVQLLSGNPLWPETLILSPNEVGDAPIELSVIQPDDLTGLRSGDAFFWPSFQALDTDVRGYPFLGPVLDWIDSYDRVLSDLIDRTALARYLVWDVTVEGKNETEIAEWIRQRGGAHAPRSGTIEVHNEKVTWDPKTAQSGAFEDKSTSQTVLTSIAAGTGLAKTWLAEPEDANRATSLTMAEPVRRRVGAVQNVWLDLDREMLRFVVDQAVIARRLPAMVDVVRDGVTVAVPSSETVQVSGPQVAAADAQITSQVLHRLSVSLEKFKTSGLLSDAAMREVSRKAWEDYMGIPWRPELSDADADPDDIATALDDAGAGSPPLAAVTT